MNRPSLSLKEALYLVSQMAVSGFNTTMQHVCACLYWRMMVLASFIIPPIQYIGPHILSLKEALYLVSQMAVSGFNTTMQHVCACLDWRMMFLASFIIPPIQYIGPHIISHRQSAWSVLYLQMNSLGFLIFELLYTAAKIKGRRPKVKRPSHCPARRF